MTAPLVSVIVPIYNVQTYLSKCIHSILDQSFREYELILVDDGSDDGSQVICDEFANNDKRVRVFHTENKGVSHARNVGLDNARGDYVIFVDSDDFWKDGECLMNLYNMAEKYSADIVRGEYIVIGADDQVLYSVSHKSPREVLMDTHLFLRTIVERSFFIWLLLIKREKISGLFFNEKRLFLEDALFYIHLLSKPLKCLYVPISFYAYRKHLNSITIRPHPQKLDDMVSFINLCLEMSKKQIKYQINREIIRIGISFYLYLCLVIAELDNKYIDKNKFIVNHDIFLIRKLIVQNYFKFFPSFKQLVCVFPVRVLILCYYLRNKFVSFIDAMKDEK